MAQEVGVAYVTLLPSGKGFGKAVEGQIDDAVGKSEKKTDSFFSRIGKGLKIVGGAVAGVATAVGAIAVTGGISRALNIEDAQAKLKGLGHDTKNIEAIMNDALASVKGTAFGLDTAATVAATAVAAGIKPGQELEKYLRLTADAATIAGISMEEMGSILNKTTTAGKVYTQELNQLADRGLPVFQWLQEEYGVTAEELRKMVAAGEVDSERFRKVIEENIGGAALASGDTTRGAFANMMAALSRLGLVFVEDALGGAKQFFGEVTVILDGLGERIAPWVDGIKDRLSGLFDIEGMGDRFLDWFDETATKIANGPLPQIIDALAPLLPILGDFAVQLGGELGDAVGKFADALAPSLPGLIESFVGALEELAPALGELAGATADLMTEAAPLIADLLVLLGPVAAGTVSNFAGAVSTLADGLRTLKGAWDLLVSGEDSAGLMDRTVDEWAAFGDAVLGLNPILAPVVGLLEMLGLSMENVSSVTQDVAESFRESLKVMGERWSEFWAPAAALVDTVMGLIGAAVNAGLSYILGRFGLSLSDVRTWWSDTWSGLVSSVSDAWSAITSRISAGIDSAVAFVRGLPGRILSAAEPLRNLLVSVGRDMIQGLINGVSGMVQRAVQAVRDVGGAMLDGVKSFLGIASPSRLFRDEVGKMVGLGLLEGISDPSIQGRIDSRVQHLVEVPAFSGAASPAFPSEVTLVDRDGSLLGLMDVRIRGAFPSRSSQQSIFGI